MENVLHTDYNSLDFLKMFIEFHQYQNKTIVCHLVWPWCAVHYSSQCFAESICFSCFLREFSQISVGPWGWKQLFGDGSRTIILKVTGIHRSAQNDCLRKEHIRTGFKNLILATWHSWTVMLGTTKSFIWQCRSWVFGWRSSCSARCDGIAYYMHLPVHNFQVHIMHVLKFPHSLSLTCTNMFYIEEYTFWFMVSVMILLIRPSSSCQQCSTLLVKPDCWLWDVLLL